VSFLLLIDLIDVPPEDSMRQRVTKIEMPSGSLLIWDGRTPHGNYPNNVHILLRDG
jgi:hypothetical protein